MILYSVIPPEIVFADKEKQAGSRMEMDWLGEKVEVMALENNRYVINRLLSTSPKAYLNPGLQPGTIIEGNWRK